MGGNTFKLIDREGKEIIYDHIYFHGQDEPELVSIYIGGFGDQYRTIYKILDRDGNVIKVKLF